MTDGASDGPLHGPVEQWVEELTALAVDHAFDTFVLSNEVPEQLRRFAAQVVPATRKSVAAARA